MTDTFVRPHVGAGTKTLPASWYTSPEVFATERERVFAHEWLCVGREDSLARPGDFFTVERAGESLIVTRDTGGRVHAFFNVCRHRGTRICEAAAGHFAGSIQCPYHAWTYGLDGALKVARNMAEVPGFDRAGYSLHEAPVALWEGFVFVGIAQGDPRLRRDVRAADRPFRCVGISAAFAPRIASRTISPATGN